MEEQKFKIGDYAYCVRFEYLEPKLVKGKITEITLDKIDKQIYLLFDGYHNKQRDCSPTLEGALDIALERIKKLKETKK